MDKSFHINWVPPTEPGWPVGAWSVYRITGDEIADRTVRERVSPNGYYEGAVIARHPWPGYLGMYATLAEVVGVIAAQE